MGFSSDFVEDILKKILGINHPVIQYLNFFRTKFDGEIHPLDQPIFYIAQITKLLIPEKLVAEKTLREWDSNLVTKVVFIASEEKFFEGMKTGAVKHFG